MNIKREIRHYWDMFLYRFAQFILPQPWLAVMCTSSAASDIYRAFREGKNGADWEDSNAAQQYEFLSRYDNRKKLELNRSGKRKKV